MKTLFAIAAATTLLAGAVHAEGITQFNIGLLGGENAQDRLNSNECLRKYAEEALGVPVKLFAPADYDGVVQGLLGGTIDMAWLGASAYAKVYLTDPKAVDVALVKTNLDGSFTYHSIGIARKDTGIAKLEDAKGKVFGFGDPNSTSGYLIPSVEIPKTHPEIKREDLADGASSYFKTVKFTGGHEQTIVAVANGDIDAGVTWADGQGNWEDGYNSGALRKAVDAGLVNMNDLVEIWKSEPIPEGPVVLRAALPDDVKAKMIDLVKGLHAKDKDCAYGVAAGDTAGFTPITADFYDIIVETRRATQGN
jgi:phosphonate transport system substrate-binding protein